MKRTYYLLLILAGLTAVPAHAEDKLAYIRQHHEVRLGWGDQLFESLMWHNPTNIATTLPVTYSRNYNENYRHHQHIWTEYQYRFNHWFGLGGMADISEVGWDVVTRNGAGIETARDKGHYFYNLVLMPTLRFTYFHHEHVNIYSGFGLGLDINGGTESDSQGRKTDVGAAVNLTLVGISANYERWFWAFDLGGMYALKNKNTIYLAGSRILNVSLGARF